MTQLERRLRAEHGAQCISKLQLFDVDMSHIQSVRSFCDMLVAKRLQLRLLILCPGYNYLTPLKQETHEHLDYSFTSIFMAHFLITVLLLPELKR